MGSVKDLQVLERPTEKKSGVGRFVFSDRYSVFDWGEMPDRIPMKGAALCTMGAYCFEQAEKEGIQTHYRGLVGEKKRLVRIEELEMPLHTMEVNLARVVEPKYKGGVYDYSNFTPRLANFVLPLEIEGSSVFKRLQRGEIRLKELGLDCEPKPGEKLAKPILDVSTKREETDRYITWQEARKIAGLTEKELEEVKEMLLEVDDLITRIAEKAGLSNEDGKIELAFNPGRELMVVDVIGTLDECRFTFNGLHVSKEIARQFYVPQPWYKDVQEAKKKAAEMKRRDWKSLCKSRPCRLEPALKQIISDIYAATANEFTGRKLFEAPRLKEAVKAYQDWHGKNRA